MNWFGRFYGTAIGKKIVVAVTGFVMVGFLVVHMLGNLLVHEGRGPTTELTKMNEYAELLRVEPMLLWALRLILLAAVVVHVVTTIRLTAQNRRARGQGYAVKRTQAATLASRTMAAGGILIAVFVVYHILHLTLGKVHSTLFVHGDVYDNVIRSFQNPFIMTGYLLAMVVVFFHLKHGVTSMCETLGVSHPRYLGLVKVLGPTLAAVLFLGFVSVPLAVFFGLVK